MGCSDIKHADSNLILGTDEFIDAFENIREGKNF